RMYGTQLDVQRFLPAVHVAPRILHQGRGRSGRARPGARHQSEPAAMIATVRLSSLSPHSKSGLPEFGTIDAQVGQARLAWGEGWGEGRFRKGGLADRPPRPNSLPLK